MRKLVIMGIQGADPRLRRRVPVVELCRDRRLGGGWPACYGTPSFHAPVELSRDHRGKALPTRWGTLEDHPGRHLRSGRLHRLCGRLRPDATEAADYRASSLMCHDMLTSCHIKDRTRSKKCRTKRLPPVPCPRGCDRDRGEINPAPANCGPAGLGAGFGRNGEHASICALVSPRCLSHPMVGRTWRAEAGTAS